jgi:hypothetical protein
MSNTSHGGHADDLQALSQLNPIDVWQTGQQTIQQTDTPEALPDQDGDYAAVKALSGNSGPIELRAPGASAGWPLEAGQETGLLPLSSAGAIQLVGAAGDGAAYYVIGE